MLKFTRDHEWISVEGDVGTVGITQFAQEKLGDLVFVDLPAVGATFDQGASACTIESVKAAADVYAPAGGEIIAVNERLAAEPCLVNASSQGDGWLFKMKIRNPAELDTLLQSDTYESK